ncbi:MAG TPA: hypothetical protein VEB68_08215 [Croceibacterium sp.]|nr:hypothetical protein [Croceibacterium sp.]
MKSFALLLAAVATTATVAVAPSMAVAAAPTADVSGTWATSFDSQVGVQTYTYTFTVEGNTLTGHAKSNLGEGDVRGTVDGDKVTFVENLDYQGQALAITYTGQIVSASEIKFKRDVAGAGGEEFTARRQG